MTNNVHAIQEKQNSLTLALEAGSLVPIASSPEEWLQRLCQGLKTQDQDWAVGLINSAINAVPAREEKKAKVANALIASIIALAPADGAECMLAVQAAVTHQHVMSYLGKAAASTLVGMAEDRLKMASRLMKIFMLQIQTLSRYRNRGLQIVRVERVVVEAGGQAVVGNVGAGGHA